MLGMKLRAGGQCGKGKARSEIKLYRRRIAIKISAVGEGGEWK
jgi:hypothetical protein